MRKIIYFASISLVLCAILVGLYFHGDYERQLDAGHSEDAIAEEQPSGSIEVEGLVFQEDDPDHDVEADPIVDKVLTLRVIDPSNGTQIDVYYLTNSTGGFHRLNRPAPIRSDPIWAYLWGGPVKVTGNLSYHQGVYQTVKVLQISDVRSSDIFVWYWGVLSNVSVDLGESTFLSRACPSFRGEIESFKMLDPETGNVTEEVLLAFRDGWPCFIPYCGTNKPIASYRLGDKVRIQGYFSTLTDDRDQDFRVLVVVDAQGGRTATWGPGH